MSEVAQDPPYQHYPDGEPTPPPDSPDMPQADRPSFNNGAYDAYHAGASNPGGHGYGLQMSPSAAPEQHIPTTMATPEQPSSLWKRHPKATAAGATALAAATLVGALVGIGKTRDTGAEAMDNFRDGLPPDYPVATAPEIPGLDRSAEVPTDFSSGIPFEYQLTLDRFSSAKAIHEYAKVAIPSLNDLQKFEAVRAYTPGQERVIADTERERQELYGSYSQVIFHALGERIVYDYNAGLTARGLDEVDPDHALEVLQKGITTDDAEDMLLRMNLIIGASTSGLLEKSDAVKVFLGNSIDEQSIRTLEQYRADNPNEILAAWCDVTDQSAIFPENHPKILRQAPGVVYKERGNRKIVQCEARSIIDGSRLYIQETYLLGAVMDPVTQRPVPVAVGETEVAGPNKSYLTSYFNLKNFPRQGE